MIVVGICTYNNADYIRATIESVQHIVDLIVVVDGRFRQYPQINKSDNSTDGTLRIVKDLCDMYPEQIILDYKQAPYATQVDQRNRYMQLLNVGDWLWIIDADEIVHTALSKDELQSILDKSKTGRELVTITNSPITYYGDRYRLVKYRDMLRYKDYHWKMVDINGDIHHNIISPLERELQQPIDKIEHIHMKNQRDPSFEDNKLGKNGAWYNQMRIEQFKVLDDTRRMLRIHNHADGSINTPEDLVKKLDEINRKLTEENR